MIVTPRPYQGVALPCPTSRSNSVKVSVVISCDREQDTSGLCTRETRDDGKSQHSKPHWRIAIIHPPCICGI